MKMFNRNAIGVSAKCVHVRSVHADGVAVKHLFLLWERDSEGTLGDPLNCMGNRAVIHCNSPSFGVPSSPRTTAAPRGRGSRIERSKFVGRPDSGHVEPRGGKAGFDNHLEGMEGETMTGTESLIFRRGYSHKMLREMAASEQ